jgi:hypothetical protein
VRKKTTKQREREREREREKCSLVYECGIRQWLGRRGGISFHKKSDRETVIEIFFFFGLRIEKGKSDVFITLTFVVTCVDVSIEEKKSLVSTMSL